MSNSRQYNQSISLSEIEKTFARNGKIEFINGFMAFKLGSIETKKYILEVEHDGEYLHFSSNDKAKLVQSAYDVYMAYFAPITNVTWV